MPAISVDQIDPPLSRIRNRQRSAAEAAQLEASIRSRGVTVPLIVRKAGNRFVLIDGEGRLDAARRIGLENVPVEVSHYGEDDDVAAQAAANIVRTPLHPIDQWRTVLRMQEAGMTLAGAAEALGLGERATRRLDRLARLHPDMLAAIDTHGLPHDEQLGVIAMAPPEVQAVALSRIDADIHDDTTIDWRDDGVFDDIAERCKTNRIPRSRAIFNVDTAGVLFEGDLFAEPGSPEDGEYTTDVQGFIDAQLQALALEVETAIAAKKRVQLAAWGKHGLVMPKGWEATYPDGKKPPKGATLFRAVRETGYQLGGIEDEYGLSQATTTTITKAELDGGAATEPSEAEAEDEPAAPAPAPKASEPRPPIDKAGQDKLAKAKTEALHAHLAKHADADRDVAYPFPVDTLAMGLVLAVHAQNVSITGYQRSTYDDIIARILRPSGEIALLTEEEYRAVLCATLARMLHVGGPGTRPYQPASGDAAEWVGMAVGADHALPRFDTADFLAHVSGAELKRLAGEHGIKAPAKVGDLRARLVGQLDKWQPASFGAPGPIPVKKKGKKRT